MGRWFPVWTVRLSAAGRRTRFVWWVPPESVSDLLWWWRWTQSYQASPGCLCPTTSRGLQERSWRVSAIGALRRHESWAWQHIWVSTESNCMVLLTLTNINYMFSCPCLSPFLLNVCTAGFFAGQLYDMGWRQDDWWLTLLRYTLAPFCTWRNTWSRFCDTTVNCAPTGMSIFWWLAKYLFCQLNEICRLVWGKRAVSFCNVFVSCVWTVAYNQWLKDSSGADCWVLFKLALVAWACKLQL